MASISFKTPEKRVDENRPLPRTPTSYKAHDLARSSSQKKARQILDTIRGLKSKRKATNETDEWPQTSTSHRRNQAWDLLGTIRSKRSTDLSTPGPEQPQTISPWKLNLEAEETPELHPRRRKSLGDILGSITNKMSPTRNTPSSSHPVNNVDTEESLECSKSPQDTEPADFPMDSEVGVPIGMLLCNLDAGLDARSWTSQAQTLDDLDEILTSDTLLSDEDRSKTPNSWLELMVNSFENSDESSHAHKSASSSPSLGKLIPTKAVDFLNDLSPNVLHDHQSIPSEHKQVTDLTVISCATETTTVDESAMRERTPIAANSDASCDSKTDLVEEHVIARHSSASENDRVADRSDSGVQQLVPVNGDGAKLVGPDPGFRQKSNAQKYPHQEPGQNYLDTAEADRQRIALSIKLIVNKMTKNLHLTSVSDETQHDWDEGPANGTNASRTDQSSMAGDSTGITYACKDLNKEFADLLTSLDPRPPSTSGIQQKCSNRGDLGYCHATPPSTSAESVFGRRLTPATAPSCPPISAQHSPSDKAQTQSQGEIVRNHLSWFKTFTFPPGPLHVKYPATDTKRVQKGYFPSGHLAIASIFDENQGDYSDTITYHQKDSFIELHPWGWPLPRIDEYDVTTRVQYPQTKGRQAELKVYSNRELALSDIRRQHILCGSVFSDVKYDSSKQCYYISAHGDGDKHMTSPWNPVLSPLQEKGESEHELPDFSDVENDFHPATTDSLKSSSSHYPDDSISDDASVNQDMSMCVETGTPHQKRDYEPYEFNEKDFDVTMFIQGRPGMSEPFLRGTKKILQYLDCLDNGDHANRIPTSAADLQFDCDATADIHDESDALSLEDMVGGMSSIFEGQPKKLSELNFNSESKSEDLEEDTASLEVKVVEHDGANTSNTTMAVAFDFSMNNKDFKKNFEDIPTPLKPTKSLVDTISVKRAVMSTIVEGPRSFSDSDRHVSGSSADRSDDLTGRENNSTEAILNELRENIYIIPVEDVGLIEENASCGNNDDASISGNAAQLPNQSPRPFEERFDSMMDFHNGIITAFRGEIEEFGFRHEGGVPEYVEETRAVSKWKRSSSFMDSHKNAEWMPKPLEVQANATTELQGGNVGLKTPLKNKELKLVTGESIQFKSPITVEDLNLRVIGKAARSSQSSSRKEKRVGALVDIFQAHGMMAPTSPPSVSHKSPARFQGQATLAKESKNNHDPKMKVAVEEQQERISNNMTKKGKEEDELSDGETDLSSSFGELLEKMDREINMSSFCS
ncbi:hypothetical protein ACMFMF_006773 [Clarireedia jacksonii]